MFEWILHTPFISPMRIKSDNGCIAHGFFLVFVGLFLFLSFFLTFQKLLGSFWFQLFSFILFFENVWNISSPTLLKDFVWRSMDFKQFQASVSFFYLQQALRTQRFC